MKMKNDVTLIEIGEESYPVAYNLNVVSELQDEFGSLQKWGEKVFPENGESDVKAIIFTFMAMINEGYDIKEIPKQMTLKKAGRVLSQLGTAEASGIIAEMLNDSRENDTEDTPS